MWNSSWTKGITEALGKTSEVISQESKRATKGLTEALEKTGEAITQAATKAKPRDNTEVEVAAHAGNGLNVDMNSAKMLKNLQMGWSTVVEGTKHAVETTREAVELERNRIGQSFLRKGFYKRDQKLPLDVEALRDAEVVYVTDRIITMSHPAMASTVNPNITAERKLAAVGHLLQRRHDGRFMVWNLSELEYNSSVLDDQVLAFSFPGSPSPPLGLLLKLLISMENWMKADARNVAVVHCLTGKGRTSTVLAAFLCWMGEAGFGDVNQALEYISKCKKIPPGELTIPSQRRYASYFKNMLDGVRPSQPPLLLKRIIMSEAPKFAKGPPREDLEETNKHEKLLGCAPYLQIFKGGKLIFTSAATLSVQQSVEELPFVQVVDGTIPFHVEQVVQGDILIRCRHLTFKKQRISMFRAAFHTGYAPANVLRLTKSQLDGACADKRFPDDFFLDLIFEKVDAETASKHLEEQAEDGTIDASSPGKGKGPVVKASNYDEMLQGDSRFWAVIANRRQEQSSEKDSDPNWGPTVGRRRGDDKKTGSDKYSEASVAAAAGANAGKLFETFSIGNEFDFLPDEPKAKAVQQPAEKDALMEALGALDDDGVDTEEIVFNDPTSGSDDSKRMESAASSVVDGGEANLPSGSENPGTETSGSKLTPAQSQVGSSAEGLEDLDSLLAAADDNLGEMNLEDFDDDDDEDLGDLEAMLNNT